MTPPDPNPGELVPYVPGDGWMLFIRPDPQYRGAVPLPVRLRRAVKALGRVYGLAVYEYRWPTEGECELLGAALAERAAREGMGE